MSIYAQVKDVAEGSDLGKYQFETIPRVGERISYPDWTGKVAVEWEVAVVVHLSLQGNVYPDTPRVELRVRPVPSGS